MLTITDDDVAPPGTLHLSAATYNVAENGGTATITITRTGGSAGCGGGHGDDEQRNSDRAGRLHGGEPDGELHGRRYRHKTLNIPIPEDTTCEGERYGGPRADEPTGGATLGSPSTAVLTITDDDGRRLARSS